MMFYFSLRGCLDADNQDEANAKMRDVIRAGKNEIGGIAPYLRQMEPQPVSTGMMDTLTQWPQTIIDFMHGSEADRKRIAMELASKGFE